MVHLFFHNVGGNKALGDKLIKEAAKKDQYGARFIEGLRWARGYGRSANLKNAASWMRPAYELSAKRDGDLAQIIENEFFNIVLHPNYVNRDMYVDLIQAAEEQRQSLEQQLAQSSGSASHATLLKSQIFDLTVTRGQLLIELADITNIMRMNIEEVLSRGERLEDVGRSSRSLLKRSKEFEKKATLLNYWKLMQKYMAGIACFLIVFLVLYF